MSAPDPFWEQPEQVERFAAREPDRRLVELVDATDGPSRVRVLDIGCAGGRNTVLLAEHGFDVYAVDTSVSMVECTRERVGRVLGVEEAKRRIRVGPMTDLSEFASGSIDLIVALGVYHNARSRGEWDAALEESERVLASRGRVLVANFDPRTDMTGDGVAPVAGEPGLFEGLPSGRHMLFDAADLDAEMRRVGLEPAVPTTTARVPLERGRRVTVNGLYAKE